MESNSTTSNDRVWLVTGASSGFGKALVQHLLATRPGARIVALARRESALAELANGSPDRVLSVVADVTSEEQVDQAVARAYERFGHVDVLVNNAGFSVVGAVEETDEATLRSTFETMFFGPARLTKAVLPRMRAAGRGSIVQISSVGGFITAPGYGAYCAAKHALEAYSEALASEVAPHGLRVLIVEPGAFRTALFGSSYRRMPELEAYRVTVGATRDYATRMEGKQPGDPAKAARAIVEAVEADKATLRLPLGADAVEGMRAKLHQVSREVDATEVIARGTTF